jgi:hypothetical protein
MARSRADMWEKRFKIIENYQELKRLDDYITFSLKQGNLDE